MCEGDKIRTFSVPSQNNECAKMNQHNWLDYMKENDDAEAETESRAEQNMELDGDMKFRVL